MPAPVGIEVRSLDRIFEEHDDTVYEDEARGSEGGEEDADGSGWAPPPPAHLLSVTCPDGCGAGDTLTVQTPAGEAQVQIPAGVKAGEAFTLQLQLGADGDGGGEGAE